MRPNRAPATIAYALILAALLVLAALPATAQPWQGSSVLAVRVTNDDGDPVVGAKVFARLSEGDPESGPAAVETGASGEALVSGLADGEWFVEISHGGYMLYTAYVDLRSGKKPQVGFSSQVNTETSFEPMKVRFVKASPSFNRGSGQTRTAENTVPEVVREEPATRQPDPSTVVRTQPKAEPPAPEVVRPAPPSQPVPERPVSEKQAAEEPAAEEPIAEQPVADEPVADEPAADEPESAAAEAPQTAEIKADLTEAESPTEDAPVTPATTPAHESPAQKPPSRTPPSSRPEPAATEEPPAARAPAEELPEPEMPSENVPSQAPEPETPAAPDMSPPESVPEPAVESLPAPTREAAEATPPVVPPPSPAAAPEPAGTSEARTPSPETEAPTGEPPTREPAAAGERAATPPSPESETAEPSTATVPSGRIPRYLRSAAAGSCSECRPGEWAVAAEQVAATSGDGPEYRECPATFEADARAGAQRLADTPAPRLQGYAGPMLTALFRIAPGEERDQIQQLIAPLSEPESYCQLAGVVLPRSAAFTGYVLEAWDSLGGRTCRGSVSCAVGQARWLAEPIIVEGRERIVVYDIFKNRSSRHERRARMTIYFEPPTTDWSPAR